MQPGEKPGAASFEPQAFAARGDVLDPWCKTATTAVNAANCGDTELRALAIERLRAFDQARSRLSWDQQKALAADQNRWATALPYTCDLESDEPPSLPLDPAVKECLVREGRSRLAFLQATQSSGSRDRCEASGDCRDAGDILAPAATRRHSHADAAVATGWRRRAALGCHE
jgi:hypothetical protein